MRISQSIRKKEAVMPDKPMPRRSIEDIVRSAEQKKNETHEDKIWNEMQKQFYDLLEEGSEKDGTKNRLDFTLTDGRRIRVTREPGDTFESHRHPLRLFVNGKQVPKAAVRDTALAINRALLEEEKRNGKAKQADPAEADEQDDPAAAETAYAKAVIRELAEEIFDTGTTADVSRVDRTLPHVGKTYTFIRSKKDGLSVYEGRDFVPEDRYGDVIRDFEKETEM